MRGPEAARVAEGVLLRLLVFAPALPWLSTALATWPPRESAVETGSGPRERMAAILARRGSRARLCVFDGPLGKGASDAAGSTAWRFVTWRLGRQMRYNAYAPTSSMISARLLSAASYTVTPDRSALPSPRSVVATCMKMPILLRR